MPLTTTETKNHQGVERGAVEKAFLPHGKLSHVGIKECLTICVCFCVCVLCVRMFTLRMGETVQCINISTVSNSKDHIFLKLHSHSAPCQNSMPRIPRLLFRHGLLFSAAVCEFGRSLAGPCEYNHR